FRKIIQGGIEMIFNDYFKEIHELLKKVEEKESENIVNASQIIADSIANDGVLHVFGCGHSQMYAMELFYRAGGLVPVNAILTPARSLAPTASFSTFGERQEGLAKLILDAENVKKQDVMLIVSTSGRNSVPIEMAIEAKNKGLKVIVLTSMAFTNEVTSRHKSGKKLYELADVVLDNHGESGDAALETSSVES